MAYQRHQRISLAIAGNTYVGKSSFINLLLNLKEGDDNYAKTGDDVTTMEPKKYYHPSNTNFSICDMPGYGTKEMPRRFLGIVNLSQFDYFLIFFHPVLREVDMIMAEILKKHNIPFALVRTKLDLYLQKQNDGDIRIAIETLRTQIHEEYKDDEQFGGCKLFLISNDTALLATCDMAMLIKDIADRLTANQHETLLLQIGILTPEIIDIKYQELKNRISSVSRMCSLEAALWIPFLNVFHNYKAIVKELNLYVQTFGLDKDFVPTVPGLTSPFSITKDRTVNWRALLGQGFSQIAQGALVIGISELNFVAPVVGSAVAGISTHRIVGSLLQNHLNELRIDALTVYTHFNRSS